MQKPNAMPKEQDKVGSLDGTRGHKLADRGLKVHQDPNKQDTGFSLVDSEAAVVNVEMGNLELNEYDFSTVASVHDHDQGSP